MSSFSFSAKKQGKIWRSSQSEYRSSTITYFFLISAANMNFEKPPADGGARGYIRNSPESARLHFHFRPRNRGKGGEHRAMVSIM